MPDRIQQLIDQSAPRRSHNRIQPLLDAAAKLFASKGFKETTLRDIGTEVGMQAGSVYYHFKSKEELLLAVYALAVEGIEERLQRALKGIDDPWQRLEAAAITHLETILDQNDYSSVMIGVTPDKTEVITADLVALRDRYETNFKRLIDALPLKKGTDRRMLRLMLLGALNSTRQWHQTGGETPASIGKSFIQFLQKPLG